MGLGSQQAALDSLTDMANLVHDVFTQGVLPNVRRESKLAMIFQEAGRGDYRLEGDAMKFAADYDYATGAMATSGKLPDHVGLDPAEGSLTPIRRYRRIAKDNFVVARGSGPGAYEDMGTRLFNILWDSWKSMEIRHALGGSSAILGACLARTSSTVFTVEDFAGHDGTNPLSHISKNSVLGWYDVDQAAAGGAGIVSAINLSTGAITVTTAGTWEPTNILAAGDGIYFATTNDSTRDYFELERNLGPNGLGVVVDPDAGLSTAFGVAESTYPRSKPYRKASVVFDHLELTEHWIQLAQKRGYDVTPATDICVAFPSVVAQAARSVISFQQQMNLGGTLKGGYDLLNPIMVANMPFVPDSFFHPDVCVTLAKEKLFRVNLGGEPDFYANDGSQWRHIADYDGDEAHVGEYMNFFCTHRGCNSALTGITTDLTDSDFTSLPDY
jgi:hypothetical protein